jgi:hypothetical protein
MARRGAKRKKAVEDRVAVLDAIKTFGRVKDPRGDRPLSPVEARLMVDAMAMRTVYSGHATIPKDDTGKERMARDRARSIKKSEQRIRRRWAAEGRSVSPVSFDDLTNRVGLALDESETLRKTQAELDGKRPASPEGPQLPPSQRPADE